MWRHGIQLSHFVEDLRPIFLEWISLYEQANEAFEQKDDRWYLEPTLVALLCAAAWRTGARSIAEVKAERSFVGGSRNGRIDLLVEKKGLRTAFEAKICWFDDAGKFADAITNLGLACSDCQSLPANTRRVALSFAILENSGRASSETLLAHAAAESQTQELDVTMWTLAPPGRSLRYPGCVVLGRQYASRGVA